MLCDVAGKTRFDSGAFFALFSITDLISLSWVYLKSSVQIKENCHGAGSDDDAMQPPNG
jgi:hypothetical protein